MTPEQIKSLQDTSASFRSQATQFTLQADAIDASVALAEKGYQSDQDAIAQQVSDGISAALSPVNDAVSAALSKVSNEKTSSQVASL